LILAGFSSAVSLVTHSTLDESIAEVTQAYINTPSITNNLTGTGVITRASVLYLGGVPTAGVSNYSIYSLSGTASFTTYEARTGFVPDANDGAYLGTTALGFSDLFFASGAVINYANGDYTLTHSAGILTASGQFNVSFGGKVKVGGTAVRATTPATNSIDLFDGTAPVGTLANGITIYSAAGEGYMMDAAGNATLQTPHDLGTGEWIFYSRNTVTGRVVRVDMERLVKDYDARFGTAFVQDYIN
jgi:hypothetical protein